MATGPSSTGSGPKQPGRTGEGAYFEGEGHEPFEGRAGDADSREAEAVVDDLINEFTGGGSTSTPTTREARTPPAAPPGGTASDSAPGNTEAGSSDGTATTSGTSRGSASAAPAAGRMG